MKHFRRLGIWKPEPGTDFNPYGDDVSGPFKEWLGFEPEDVDARGPLFHRRLIQLVDGVCNQDRQAKVDHPIDYPTTFWHRDGVDQGGDEPDDEWQELIMWSNRKPTEICLPNGRIVQGRSCEVIAFRNTTCLHRTPLLRWRDQSRRNFIRAIVPSDLTFLD